jgi:hypothetical protein
VNLVHSFGEMWARNPKNINLIPGSRTPKGGDGIYVLYDGSVPVYVGKGHIKSRIRKAKRSKSRGPFWDHFSWYILNEPKLIHDTEVLILRMLPTYLRFLTKQKGHFGGGAERVRELEANQIAEFISRKVIRRKKKKKG